MLIIGSLGVVTGIAMDELPAMACDSEQVKKDQPDREICIKNMRTFLYIVWVLGSVTLVPLQFLICSVFKAYRDEIKLEGPENE